MNQTYDVVIIGAGPAGYVAAIRCAQLGLNTACIDKWLDEENQPKLGGTCLNVGCIPSKALLESSEIYQQSQSSLSQHCIITNAITLDLQKMMNRKKKVIDTLTQGIESLFKSNHIDWLQGQATIKTSTQAIKEISIQPHHHLKTQIIQSKNIIIATGSSPINIPSAPIDNHSIVDSTGALAFDIVPHKLGIIGAGVIGLELGSVWNRLGSQVTIFEAQDNFLSFADEFIAKESLKKYRSQGLTIQLKTRLLHAVTINQQVQVTFQNSQGEHHETFDKLIIAVGRSPNSHSIFSDQQSPEQQNLVITEGGFIHVNERCETSLPGIYAIGDTVRGPMLAHKGSEEGLMVAELISGNFRSVNYDLIPSVIYTHPELAWVGKTEQNLKAIGVDYKIGIFPFSASGRAQAVNEKTGMFKILSDTHTDRILGVHIFGTQASELIAQAVIAMEFSASAEDISLIMFAHPTFSEAFHEAALAVSGNALHITHKKEN
jgi:dihydrolipoamide dehydrogenase